MPLTGWPAAAVAVLASGAAPGIGTPSGPCGPGAGAGLRLPRVCSGASFGADALAAPCPPVTARVMPTAAAATTTTAPSPPSHSLRRRRRASSARAFAIFSRACCRFLLLLDTEPLPLPRAGPAAARARHRGSRVNQGLHLLSTDVDSSTIGLALRAAGRTAGLRDRTDHRGRPGAREPSCSQHVTASCPEGPPVPGEKPGWS